MIEISQAKKSFGKNQVIQSLSCQIKEGSIYGLIGANGSGKSTLLRMIVGIYQLDNGSIKVAGIDTFDQLAIKSKMVFVPDELFFFEGYHALAMAQYYSHIYSTFDFERFYHLAEVLKLDVRKNLNTFSKGMKRKVAIILALSCKVDYYFFDETFDGLDPVVRKVVNQLICDEVAQRNATFIITSHNLRELEDICDQIGLLYQGGLLFESDLDSLKMNMSKIQVAFDHEIVLSELPFTILHHTKVGSVYSFIVKGNREEAIDYFKKQHPLILDVLPLTLEEVFIHEMEVLGYAFEDFLV
ncbi:MAG: ABC transporter ATP-binding protein [Erysipelotrichaceae bacterium]|nr:ABC transporter ATP-binding protein [Erysipelotrichaceae bacterium]